MRAIKRIINVIRKLLSAVLVFLLLCSVYLLGAKFIAGENTPKLFGYSWAVVLSGSMEPAISVDDLVVSRERSSYSQGDIITFETGGYLTTHRIVQEAEEGFVTKGDANNTEDADTVSEEQIIGEVVLIIPEVGRFIRFMKTPLVMACLVLIGLLLIELPYIFNKKP